MSEEDKRKKLDMLPWQALFDFAVGKEIDEAQIKGKEKSVIISKLLSEAMITDSEIEDLVNDYIYGDRVSFTLWNFDKKPTQAHYDNICRLGGGT